MLFLFLKLLGKMPKADQHKCWLYGLRNCVSVSLTKQTVAWDILLCSHLTHSLQWPLEHNFHFFPSLTLKNCRLWLSKSGLGFKRNNWPWDKTAQGSFLLFSTEAIFQQDIEFSLDGYFFGMCVLSA